MAELLKDLYSPSVIAQLGELLAQADARIDCLAFAEWVQAGDWPHLALKQRIARVADGLAQWIPGDFAAQLTVLDAMHPHFKGFVHIAIPEFVARHGLHAPELALPALARYTGGSSAEFALRPFLLKYPEATRAALALWVQHPDAYVRRLASEGTRPRLPWGLGLPALKRDPSPNLPLLEALKQDPSDYVRRSVANHLNDISKDHPRLVLELAARWHGHHQDTDKLVKHALRGLLKQGDTQALAVVGHSAQQALVVTDVWLSAQALRIGDRLELRFTVQNTADESLPLRLEYAVHYVKANGSTSPKVFQVAQTTLPGGDTGVYKTVRHLHDMTTRRHYVGTHALQPIVNGVRGQLIEFELLA